MTWRRSLVLLSGFLVGSWPAGLLVGGVDFYRFPAELAAGLLVGLVGVAGAWRVSWVVAVTAGLSAAFGVLLLVAGAEWRFIGFAFARALPVLSATAAGALVGLALEQFRVRTATAPSRRS